MVKIKVSEAAGAALDWMVAKALGHKLKVRNWESITDTLDPVENADIIAFHRERNTVRVSAEQIPGGGWFPNPLYSTDWSQGGPIIERERIHVTPFADDPGWFVDRASPFDYIEGPTLLIAAMRCYCCSKLGDIVDVPEELCQQQSS